MDLKDLIESELRRLEMVKSETLENAGVRHYIELKPVEHKMYVAEYEAANAQTLKMKAMLTQVETLEAKFNDYETRKRV